MAGYAHIFASYRLPSRRHRRDPRWRTPFNDPFETFIKPRIVSYCMVAKLILEKEHKGEFKPARVLYTGTSRRYLYDRIEAEGEFVHPLPAYVYLDPDPRTAMSYAAERSIFYRDPPVVLVVDAEKLRREIYDFGGYRARALNVGSFLPYKFNLDPDGKFTVEDYRKVCSIGDRIIRTSEEDTCRELFEFLAIEP